MRNDPGILQGLFSATLEITNLARTVTQDSTRDAGKHYKEIHSSPFQEEESLANVPNSTSWEPASSDPNITEPTFNMVDQDWSPDIKPFRKSSSFLPEGGIFGNGWFGMMPSLPNIRSRDTSLDDPEGGFAFTLTHTILNLMYNSLVHDSSSSLVLKICRLALCMYQIHTDLQQVMSQMTLSSMLIN